MKDWFYSDPHFGHGRIVAYAKRPAEWWRPAEPCDLSSTSPLAKVKRVAGRSSTHWYEVPDVVAMEDALVERWNARVGREDTVHMLGDFAWWRLPMHEVKRIRARLNGHVTLVLGNHDVDKLGRPLPAVHQLFARGPEMEVPNVTFLEGPRVLLCHYGPRSWGKHHRPNELLLQAELLLHGHSHNYHGTVSWFDRGDGRMIPAVDMSVEGWDYAPASLDEILAHVEQR